MISAHVEREPLPAAVDVARVERTLLSAAAAVAVAAAVAIAAAAAAALPLLANVEAAALTRTTFALACLAGSAIAGTTVEERPFRAAPSREETPLGAVVAHAPRLKPSRSLPERRPEGRLFHPGAFLRDPSCPWW